MELNLTGRQNDGHGTSDEFAALSVILIDGDQIFIDNGAIHGKSRLERGVDFTTYKKPEEVPNGETIPSIWVMLKKYESGMGYSGVVATSIVVNKEERVGYKSVAALVNAMDGAMKGKISISTLSNEHQVKLVKFLEEMRPDLWANTPHEVKAALI